MNLCVATSIFLACAADSEAKNIGFAGEICGATIRAKHSDPNWLFYVAPGKGCLVRLGDDVTQRTDICHAECGPHELILFSSTGAVQVFTDVLRVYVV